MGLGPNSIAHIRLRCLLEKNLPVSLLNLIPVRGMEPRPGPKALVSPPKVRKMERPPTPQELISYYESRGLDNAQASLKVIEDLQNLLLRSISSSREKDRLPSADRLAVLEMKLDSKPGFMEAFAVAVAGGATIRAVPHVVRALGQAWSTVAGGISGDKR